MVRKTCVENSDWMKECDGESVKLGDWAIGRFGLQVGSYLELIDEYAKASHIENRKERNDWLGDLKKITTFSDLYMKNL